MDSVQMEFRDGVIAEEATWQAVVLLPKGGGKYRGIGLVEVVRKVVTVILNFFFTASITYHNSLYGFRMCCSTGTAYPEIKLLQ